MREIAQLWSSSCHDGGFRGAEDRDRDVRDESFTCCKDTGLLA